MFTTFLNQISQFNQTTSGLVRISRWWSGLSVILSANHNIFALNTKDGVSFESTLKDLLTKLQQRSSQMNWLMRWLTGINTLIQQYQSLLAPVAEAKFNANVITTRQLSLKIETKEVHVKAAVKAETYTLLSQHLVAQKAFVDTIVTPAPTVMPMKISSFGCGNPNCGTDNCYSRNVNARTSSGKPMTYANLLAEQRSWQQENTRLHQHRPARTAASWPMLISTPHLSWNVGARMRQQIAINWDATQRQADDERQRAWGREVDNCDAGSNYVKARMRDQVERAPQVAIDVSGKPHVIGNSR